MITASKSLSANSKLGKSILLTSLLGRGTAACQGSVSNSI